MKQIKMIRSTLVASFDVEFNTAAQGTKNAKADEATAWIEASEWTESGLRQHLSVVIDASPAYVDAYIKELYKHGLRKA